MCKVLSKLVWLFECRFVSGICEFVIIIGLFKFLNMNDSVEVV